MRTKVLYFIPLMTLSCASTATSEDAVNIIRHEEYSTIHVGAFRDTVYMDYPSSELAFFVDSASKRVYYNEYNRMILAVSYLGEVLYSYPLYKHAPRSWRSDYFLGKFGDKIIFSNNATLLIFYSDLRIFRDVVKEDIYESPEGSSLHHRLCRFEWDVKKDTLYFYTTVGLDCNPNAVDDTLYRKIFIGS